MSSWPSTLSSCRVISYMVNTDMTWLCIHGGWAYGSDVCKFGFVGRLRNVDSTAVIDYTAKLNFVHCCPTMAR